MWSVLFPERRFFSALEPDQAGERLAAHFCLLRLHVCTTTAGLWNVDSGEQTRSSPHACQASIFLAHWATSRQIENSGLWAIKLSSHSGRDLHKVRAGSGLEWGPSTGLTLTPGALCFYLSIGALRKRPFQLPTRRGHLDDRKEMLRF